MTTRSVETAKFINREKLSCEDSDAKKKWTKVCYFNPDTTALGRKLHCQLAAVRGIIGEREHVTMRHLT